MDRYFKVVAVEAENLNVLLDRGWEIIETTKKSYEYETEVVYHIGFPIKTALNMALEILKLYDKHDFRLSLIEAVASEIGVDLDKYESQSNRLLNNRGDEVTKLFEQTDFLMSGVLFPNYEIVTEEELERRASLNDGHGIF